MVIDTWSKSFSCVWPWQKLLDDPFSHSVSSTPASKLDDILLAVCTLSPGLKVRASESFEIILQYYHLLIFMNYIQHCTKRLLYTMYVHFRAAIIQWFWFFLCSPSFYLKDSVNLCKTMRSTYANIWNNEAVLLQMWNLLFYVTLTSKPCVRWMCWVFYCLFVWHTVFTHTTQLFICPPRFVVSHTHVCPFVLEVGVSRSMFELGWANHGFYYSRSVFFIISPWWLSLLCRISQ